MVAVRLFSGHSRFWRGPCPCPTSAIEPVGQDLGAPCAPTSDVSTAPIALECKSFLDNRVAQFRAARSCNEVDSLAKRLRDRRFDLCSSMPELLAGSISVDATAAQVTGALCARTPLQPS
jgi:hypothetical protein